MLKFKNNLKGSFTIEATLVFTTVFLSLIALIYASIFMYNKVYFQYIVNMTMSKNNFVKKNIQNYSNNITIYQKDLLIYNKKNVNFEKEYPIPLDGLLNQFGFDGVFKISETVQSVDDNPVRLIRSIDFVNNLLTK